MEKKKFNIPLLISAILGVAYSIYIISYFAGGMNGAQTDTEVIGGAIATALVTPHMICVVIASIFNVIAVFINKKGLALTGAILYCVAAVMFFLYALFVVPSIILSFVGYAKLRKADQ